MTKLNQKTNFILQISIKFLAVGLGFFTTRWVVANTSISEYENYNLVLAYTNIILPIINLGLPQLIQKQYTNYADHHKLADFWTTTSILRLFSYFIGLILIFITFPISQTKELGLILGVFSIQSILLADLNYRSVCDAKGHSWQFSLTDFFSKLILVLLLLLSGHFLKFIQTPIYYFIFVSGIAYTVGITSDFFWQKKYTPIGKFDIQIIKDNFKPLIYLTISAVTIGIYLTSDKLILKYFGYSSINIGAYSNAYKIFELAVIIPSLTMPVVASILKKKLDTLSLTKFGGLIYNKLFKITKQSMYIKHLIVLEWVLYGLIAGFILTIAISITSPLSIFLIDSKMKYPEAVAILPALSISLTFMFVMFLLANLNIFLGGEKYEFISTFITMIIGLSSYFLLIPNFGLFGAAISTVIIYFTDMVLKGYFCWKLLNNSL